MSDHDLIFRGDAMASVQLGNTVTKMQARIAAIPSRDANGSVEAAVNAERERMKEWCAKRQKITSLNWERAARKALAGDMSELRNRIAMIDAGPLNIVLSDDEAQP